MKPLGGIVQLIRIKEKVRLEKRLLNCCVVLSRVVKAISSIVIFKDRCGACCHDLLLLTTPIKSPQTVNIITSNHCFERVASYRDSSVVSLCHSIKLGQLRTLMIENLMDLVQTVKL